MKDLKKLTDVTAKDVTALFTSMEKALHKKVDDTRDAYFGFIFPISLDDFRGVCSVFQLNTDTANQLLKVGRTFSSFTKVGRGPGTLTNHIYGASILTLRGRDLNTGLGEVNNKTLAEYVAKNEHIVMDIAEIRSTWFGKMYFPAQAFANAISVFGGKVSPEAIYELASKYGYSAMATKRQTVRGDFGIAVWLMLLGTV
jgi:hypothetical protein